MKYTNFLALLLIIAVAANAQQLSSSQSQNLGPISMLSGRIFDPNGAVVTNIKVLIRGQGQTYQAVTNEEGVYKIALPSGTYRINVEGFGFYLPRPIEYQLAATVTQTLDIAASVRPVCMLTVNVPKARKARAKRRKKY